MSKEKLKQMEKKAEDYFFGRKDEVSILAALLDFFSDSALGYVSAFVACIFGLFATVNLMESQTDIGFWLLSLIVYPFLFLGGGYSLLNFTYYIRLAKRVKRELASLTKYKGESETTFEENYVHVVKRSPKWLERNLWRPFFWVKNRSVLSIALLGYLLVTLTPLLLELCSRYGFIFSN